ncbi:MAG: inorganic phosphate transporter [Acidimicrobiia bacterium]
MSGLDLAIALAIGYAFTNGLHDAANSIATLVATRAARPGPAVVLAAAGNILGPLLFGAAVADVVAGIVQVPPAEMVGVIGAALTGAVTWNLVTWKLGLPSSSGHALVGGLAGAAIAADGLNAVNWGPLEGWKPSGVGGVLLALAVAPIAGFVAGWAFERVLRWLFARASGTVRGPVRAAQWVASGVVAFGHGANDGQKAIGLIAAMLLATGKIGTLAAPTWAALACGVALTAGTALGGWPIVRTVGQRLFRLRPADSLASQGGSALVLIASTAVGAPVSTTQIVASSVVGAGSGRRRMHHIHWPVVREILVAWLVTLPVCAALGAVAVVPWRWWT